MTRTPPPLPGSDPSAPEEGPDAPPPDIIERPDGFYWIAEEGRAEVGPFDSYEAAEADRDGASGDAPEPGESLREAESELGLNEWLDSETGSPAEGQSPPHLDSD